jgi:dienelactone hydrolase
MDIEHLFIENTGLRIPAILLRPAHPRGGAVILHGYGGNKEEQLGLGWQAAEAGLAACVIDYRGHGEHPLPLDTRACEDLCVAIKFCRKFGDVTAIGHSLGGRLALLSDADCRIAVSPSLSQSYGEQTQGMLKALRSYRVRPPEISALLELQAALPVWNPAQDTGKVLVLYAERDAPEIVAGCTALEAAGVRTLRIPGAFHNDIFLAGQTFTAVRDQIREWYGIGP